MEQKVPCGNRNAMRRDLFTYVSECQETIREFQTLVDDSPGEQEEDEERYSLRELPLSEACLGLLKCSCGRLKASMEMMDHLGSASGTTLEDTTPANDTSDTDRWQALATLHERACTVGYGVTDFGAALYPPLWSGDDADSSEVRREVERQAQALRQLLQYVVVELYPRYDFPEATWNVVLKIQSAVEERTAEALQGIMAHEG